jgi:hypothetical protein
MDWLPENHQRMRAAAMADAHTPLVGVTTGGQPLPDLFPIERTGVSTRPITEAASAFLTSLPDDVRGVTQKPIDAAEWRTWSNISPFVMRHGVLLDDLNGARRELALGVVQASLSAAGFETARNVMRLNETIGELTGAWLEYGEFVYFLTIFGEPSVDEPWGWQLDGHHCNLHCLVLKDQLVLTPAFLGSEPVYAESGRHTGTRVFELEESRGLELIRALSPTQQARAMPGGPTDLTDLPPGRERSHNHIRGGAQQDNLQLAYEGIRFDHLDADQQRKLVELVQVYTGRIRPGHAEVKLEEVKRHLDQTWFAWYGGTADDSVFYYRVHSPVVLIEFDHQSGVVFDNDTPARIHIHTVVRTPNGNDYGKDLLRQHYAHSHAPQPPSTST